MFGVCGEGGTGGGALNDRGEMDEKMRLGRHRPGEERGGC